MLGHGLERSCPGPCMPGLRPVSGRLRLRADASGLWGDLRTAIQAYRHRGGLESGEPTPVGRIVSVPRQRARPSLRRLARCLLRNQTFLIRCLGRMIFCARATEGRSTPIPEEIRIRFERISVPGRIDRNTGMCSMALFIVFMPQHDLKTTAQFP